MRKSALILALSTLSVCGLACRKELTYGRKGVTVHITVDWSAVGAKPEGMRAIFYPIDGTGQPIVENIDPDNATVEVPPGRYSVVLFNNDSETILIRGEESFATIEAYTRTIAEVTPGASPSQGNTGGVLDTRADGGNISVVNPPDKLFGVSIGELMVGDSTSKIEEQALPVKPVMLVSQYSLCQSVGSGGEYVRRVRGAISGVPKSILLGSQQTATDPSLIVTDCAQRDPSMVTATFTCFGTATPQPEASLPVTLALELTMPDASKTVMVTDVTKIVTAATPSDPTVAPPTPLPVPGEIVIPYVPPPVGDGGIDVGVGDWEQEEIPLHASGKKSKQATTSRKNAPLWPPRNNN